MAGFRLDKSSKDNKVERKIITRREKGTHYSKCTHIDSNAGKHCLIILLEVKDFQT